MWPPRGTQCPRNAQQSSVLIQHHSEVEHKTYSLTSILPYTPLEQQWWVLFIDTQLLADNQPDTLVPYKCFWRPVFLIKALTYHDNFQPIEENIQTILLKKVISHYKSGLPSSRATTNCMESYLKGILLILIHYSFEKNMAKMDTTIKLRKQHKVKRMATFSSFKFVF